MKPPAFDSSNFVFEGGPTNGVLEPRPARDGSLVMTIDRIALGLLWAAFAGVFVGVFVAMRVI